MAKRYTIGSGITKYIKTLESIDLQGPTIAGHVIYEGAAVVADQIKTEINALPVSDRGSSTTITPEQKKGLADGFGISKMRDENGNFNVKLGFDGYNTKITKSYPKGQPNAMIARSVISGTSWFRKNDFIEKAVKASRAKALEAMKTEVDKQYKKLSEG